MCFQQKNLKLRRFGLVLTLALFVNGTWADEGPTVPISESITNAGERIPPDTPTQMSSVVINGVATFSALPANIPASTESLTAQQINESINAVTTAGVLEYLPSVHVRERYIGDVNGILVMRANSAIASAVTIVYADGMLLSNFLNNSYSTPPRWGMVSPEEINSVDVIYGPFSALYPGNSEGGVVNITTNMPSKLEEHVDVDAMQQHFKLFGTDSTYNGTHGAASLGNKIGNFSFLVSGDHLDNTGQPMTFGAATPTTKTGTYVPVTGAIQYINPANVPTVITSAIGIDHSIQDNSKIKLAYDFSPTVRATYIWDIWQNNSNKTVDSYLTNGAGQTVYAGNVAIDGRHYTVAAPAAATQLSEYYMNGLKIKSSTGGRWDWEVDASDFTEAQDDVRTSFGNTGITPSSAATAGTIAIGDGTGWKNMDLRGDFRPDGNLNSTHQLSFGYHVDDYILQSITDNLMSGSNWNSSAPGTLSLNSMGQTQTQALYIQDAWKMAQAWKLIVGGRLENWQAFDGSNYANGSNVVYQNRAFNAFSPKISLSYQPSEDWDFRGSFGRGTRFPTVGELFANVGLTNLSTGTIPTSAQIAALPAPYNQPTNNPDLLPEAVDAWELTAERWLGSGLWRNSLFTEFKQNALISQIDVMTLPGYAINTVQNVDGVRTIGYESVLEMNDLWKRGLDFSGSVTLVNSIITADARNPGLVGTLQPRIPDFRSTLTGTYHVNERLLFGVDYRFSGRQHMALYNTATHSYTDPNPDVYGNTSDYSVIDAKVLYKVGKQWSASLGVNNISNCQYFDYHPYPMRTWFASGKYDL